MHSGYYEAILQIRPREREVELFIKKKFADSRKASISSIKKLKTGIDYYITSWEFAVSLGNHLVRKFGGTVLVSKKIYGKTKKKGQIVYRCTVLYRGLDFKKGDVISGDSGIYHITSASRKITGKNLVSGKKEHVDLRKEWTVEKVQNALVSVQSPVQIIDPADYQSKPVENMKSSGLRRLRIVYYKGKIYSVS